MHCALEFASPAVCAGICYPPHFMDLMDLMDQMDKNTPPEEKSSILSILSIVKHRFSMLVPQICDCHKSDYSLIKTLTAVSRDYESKLS